jgi:hypothetical protein
MSIRDELLALEEGFWRAAGSRDAYAEHLANDAVHLFPGWGLTSDNERVLKAVEGVEPWETFAIEDPTLLELGERCGGARLHGPRPSGGAGRVRRRNDERPA